jgi:HNH endonuclease
MLAARCVLTERFRERGAPRRQRSRPGALTEAARVHRWGKTRSVPARILKADLSTKGYPMVSLSLDGVTRNHLAHRLVLGAYRGECPDEMQARHGNAVRADVRLMNLRWDTRSANEQDKIRHGNHHHAGKTHCVNGHEFTPENTQVYISAVGGTVRQCKACARAAVIRSRQRARSNMTG